jgi:hypothetical protein
LGTLAAIVRLKAPSSVTATLSSMRTPPMVRNGCRAASFSRGACRVCSHKRQNVDSRCDSL